jgi:lysozyme family protein
MANFDKAIKKTLAHEGGATVTNDATDAGGLTKYGISQRAYPELNIAGLTEKRAKEIYKADYWDMVRGDDIENQVIAESMFDFGVNSGPGRAIKLAQKASGAEPDGIMGMMTIRALLSMGTKTFINCYAIEKIKFYRDIVTNNSSQKKYLLGWINRSLEGL